MSRKQRDWLKCPPDSGQKKNCAPAPQHIQTAVRALVAQVGRVAAAAQIGISKETVLAVIADLQIRPGSQALLREWYSRQE